MGSHISPNISGNIIIKTLNTSFYPNLVLILKMKTMVMYSYLFTIGVVMIKTLASPISEAQSQKAMQYVGIGCCDSELDLQFLFKILIEINVRFYAQQVKTAKDILMGTD